MQKTKYYCDNCEQEVEKGSLTKIHLSIKLDERAPTFTKEICDNCINDLGLVDHRNEKEYIRNYTHLGKNVISTIKKVFKK